MPYVPMLIIALCIVGAVLWFVISLRDVTRCRGDLERADKQLAMYLALHSKARDGPEKVRTQEQVDISQTIYHNVTHDYNLCLTKPQNRILTQIMGYRPIEERGQESTDVA